MPMAATDKGETAAHEPGPADGGPVVPADFHCGAVSGSFRSECSLWWRQVPALPGEQPGLIGRFRSEDPLSARLLLDAACARLARHGCTVALGPMDGSTWNAYRLITDPGTAPPFFLEPRHPAAWPGYFRDSGFAEFARYSSRLQCNMRLDDPRLPVVRRRMEKLGVRIRPMDVSQVDRELARIYAVSTNAFCKSFLYTPISAAAFYELYMPLLPFLDPGLVLIAEREDQCVGFVLGLPDRSAQSTDIGPGTLIVKTVAVLPDRGYAGLGKLLWAGLCETAVKLGYVRAINALMHDGGHSFNMSRQHSVPMRRYALFARRLR